MAAKNRQCRICSAPVDPKARSPFCYTCKHKEVLQSAGESVDKFITLKCKYAKNNAGRRKIEYDIKIDDIRQLYDDQAGCCAVTGLPMMHSTENPDFSLSIDRKDSSRGYVKNNIQLVCWRVNTMKSNMDPESFHWWCKLIARH